MNAKNIIRAITGGLFRLVFRNRPAQLPLDPSSVRKILILRYDVMGDMVVTTPLISFLKKRLPNAEIHVVGSQRNIGVLRCNPHVSRVYYYEFNFRSFFRIARQCRRERYNVVFATVFHKTTKSGIWANFCGGRRAVKVTNMHFGRAALYSSMFNAMIPLRPGIFTMAEVLIQLAAGTFGLGYSADDIEFGINYDIQNAASADAIVAEIAPDVRIFVNISAGKPERTWPLDKWSEFLNILHYRYPQLWFFVAGSPAEAANVRCIADECKNFTNAVPPSSDILDVCAVIDRCRIVISPDTAVVHIASAFSKPTLGIYSPLYLSKEFSPYYEPYHLVLSPAGQPVTAISAVEAAEGFAELFQKIQNI